MNLRESVNTLSFAFLIVYKPYIEFEQNYFADGSLRYVKIKENRPCIGKETIFQII